MDFPLTHADCAGAGLYVFTKRRGPGVGFYSFVTTWPCCFFGGCTNYSIPSTKSLKLLTASSD